MSTLDLIAKRLKEKPMPSVAAFQILKIIEDDNHSLKDVLRIVENDPSLTSEVLKIANSAAYYRGTPVITVDRAILLMGEMMLVGVAIGASTSIVYHRPLEGYDSKTGDLWEHSLCSAIASRELATHAKDSVFPGLAFTAGLLHDIGKSVISEFFVGSTEEMTELCQTGQVQDYLEAERRTVGTDHSRVGYELAKQWGLPEVLCMAIRDHHCPSHTPDAYRALVYTVHLGDVVSMMTGSGTGSDSLAYTIDNNYEEYLTIDGDDLSLLVLKVAEDFATLKDLLIPKQKI